MKRQIQQKGLHLNMETNRNCIDRLSQLLFTVKIRRNLQNPSSNGIIINSHPHVQPPFAPGSINLLRWPGFLLRSLDIDGLQSALPGRIQICQMSRHHRALAWLQPQFFACRSVNRRMGLISAELLGAKNMRPGEMGVGGHISE